MTVALYARVSTNDQDASRQLDELRAFADTEFPDADTREFVDIVTGTADEGGEQYQQLRQSITDREIDAVVVHELSRLSRLGGGEIHEFLEFCLGHDTGVRDMEVGLSIDVDDSAVDRAVTEMIASIMGDLARIEHRQKLRRIRSGIDAAQSQGTWTGRPPLGFTVDDGHLRVDVEEFLRVRGAVERVDRGEQYSTVADDTGIATSTLRQLHTERSDLYLRADADDSRVDAALDELRPLDDPDTTADEFDTRVRAIVRDELDQ